MANDFVERLANVLHNLIGCATPEGQIIDLESFNESLEEFAYIINKMYSEVF